MASNWKAFETTMKDLQSFPEIGKTQKIAFPVHLGLKKPGRVVSILSLSLPDLRQVITRQVKNLNFQGCLASSVGGPHHSWSQGFEFGTPGWVWRLKIKIFKSHKNLNFPPV